jgi:glutamate/tyrosine decarboxylase-like PLP-dependent enzyme
MYASKQAHSCVEKAAMIATVKIRLLDTDENYSLRASVVEKAIKDDKINGLIPFYVNIKLKIIFFELM